MAVHRFRHHPMLGTRVEVTVRGVDAFDAERVDDAVVVEVERLENIFSIFRPGSELQRWKRGKVSAPSTELTEVIRLAHRVQLASGGRLNPLAGVLTNRWQQAAADGVEPSTNELARLAASIANSPVGDRDGAPQPVGDANAYQLHAVAKGWIVDRAATAGAAVAPGAEVVVNAGGDLRHIGPAGTAERVDIENPLRPYDNEPALATIRVANGGVASSGRSRRGVRVAGTWHSHVIDPRTGLTVDSLASITVIADDTATADIGATVLGLGSATEAVDDPWATEHRLGVVAIAPDGELVTNLSDDQLTILSGA